MIDSIIIFCSVAKNIIIIIIITIIIIILKFSQHGVCIYMYVNLVCSSIMGTAKNCSLAVLIFKLRHRRTTDDQNTFSIITRK